MKMIIILLLVVVLLSGCSVVRSAYGEVVDKPSTQPDSKIETTMGDRYKVVIRAEGNTYTFRVNKADYELVEIGSEVYFTYQSSDNYWKAELTPVMEGKGDAD